MPLATLTTLARVAMRLLGLTLRCPPLRLRLRLRLRLPLPLRLRLRLRGRWVCPTAFAGADLRPFRCAVRTVRSTRSARGQPAVSARSAHGQHVRVPGWARII